MKKKLHVVILAMLFGLQAQGLQATQSEGASRAAAAKNTAENSAAPGSSEAAPLEQPLITVEGFPLTTQDYMNFLQANPTVMSRAIGTEVGKAEALRELVRLFFLRRALYTEGLLSKDDKGSPPTPKAVADAYEKLAAKHFPAPPKADEKTAYSYYLAHPDDFGIPASVRLNQILFKYPLNAEPQIKAATRERAEVALKRLEEGDKFAVVAAELSENPIGKVANGDIGFIEPGGQPWMIEAIKDKPIGYRTGLLESPEGFQILEITDNRPALTAPFANVHDKVLKAIQDESQKKVRDAYVRELAKNAKIEFVAPNIKSLFPDGLNL